MDHSLLEPGEDRLEEALGIFKSLVRFDTSNPPGREISAIEYLRSIIEARDIECRVYEPEPGRANIVARIAGADRTPVVLLSHVDVVPADPSKWSHAPFSADEDDGVIWGRGTLDTKQLTVMELAAFLFLKDSGRKPDRDVYFIATADEEAGSRLGMEFIARELPDLMSGMLAINEGGGFPITCNGRRFILCNAGEKGMCRIRLHAADPEPDGACLPAGEATSLLATGIRRLASYRPKPVMGTVARRFIIETGLNAADPGRESPELGDLLNYILYDSVIVNSIKTERPEEDRPRTAEAELEFRVAPSATETEIRALVASLMEGSGVAYEITAFDDGFESNLDSPLMALLEKNCRHFGLDAALLPIIALGRTDGRFLGRNGSSVYGFSPVLMEDDFFKVLKRVHGNDERIARESFLFGCKVLSRTLMELCAFQEA
jgi:acetylornithine deacetylase/succinyl-diaminopimelate desuccinylase-like protein